jgi:hypothetical protein
VHLRGVDVGIRENLLNMSFRLDRPLIELKLIPLFGTNFGWFPPVLQPVLQLTAGNGCAALQPVQRYSLSPLFENPLLAEFERRLLSTLRGHVGVASEQTELAQ